MLVHLINNCKRKEFRKQLTTKKVKYYIMKKIPFIILSMLFVALISILSCQKTIPEKGDVGRDGNSVLSGSGIPNFSLGKIGDFFMDTTGKVLWGPKNTTNWGAGAALVGPQGLPGKSTLSGNGAPAAGAGAVGDFYIDITAKLLYGPNTAVGWGTGVSLVGPMGAAGAVGAAGTPAQVIYSPWVTSPFAVRDTSIDGTCLKVKHIVAPSLTASIINQGVMLTYFRVSSIGPYLLPYVSDAGNATNQLNSIFTLNKIFIYRHTFNTCRFSSSIPAEFPGQPVMVTFPTNLEFRYVLIPGLISGGRMAAGNQTGVTNIILPGQTSPINIAGKSYEDVCKLLGINP